MKKKSKKLSIFDSQSKNILSTIWFLQNMKFVWELLYITYFDPRIIYKLWRNIKIIFYSKQIALIKVLKGYYKNSHRK